MVSPYFLNMVLCIIVLSFDEHMEWVVFVSLWIWSNTRIELPVQDVSLAEQAPLVSDKAHVSLAQAHVHDVLALFKPALEESQFFTSSQSVVSISVAEGVIFVLALTVKFVIFG